MVRRTWEEMSLNIEKGEEKEQGNKFVLYLYLAFIMEIILFKRKQQKRVCISQTLALD